MSLFDLLLGMFIGGFGSSPADRGGPHNPAEQATGIVGVVVLPAVGFCLVLFEGLVDPVVALLAIPCACVAVATCLCLILRTSVAWALRLALGCGTFAFVLCGIAWLMAVFAGFFKDF